MLGLVAVVVVVILAVLLVVLPTVAILDLTSSETLSSGTLTIQPGICTIVGAGCGRQAVPLSGMSYAGYLTVTYQASGPTGIEVAYAQDEQLIYAPKGVTSASDVVIPVTPNQPGTFYFVYVGLASAPDQVTYTIAYVY